MSAPELSQSLTGLSRRWGSFWDTNATQTIPSAGATALVTLNNSDPLNSGVSVVSGSQVTFASSGIYSITFSVQFANSSSTVHIADMWLRKNGITSAFDVADSNSRFSIISKHGSNNGHIIGCVNFVMSMNASDYVVLAWSAENTAVFIETTPAATGTPTTPRAPGVILTAVQV